VTHSATTACHEPASRSRVASIPSVEAPSAVCRADSASILYSSQWPRPWASNSLISPSPGTNATSSVHLLRDAAELQVLYAVGVGAKADELSQAYELSPAWSPLPTYPLVLGLKGDSQDVTDFSVMKDHVRFNLRRR